MRGAEEQGQRVHGRSGAMALKAKLQGRINSERQMNQKVLEPNKGQQKRTSPKPLVKNQPLHLETLEKLSQNLWMSVPQDKDNNVWVMPQEEKISDEEKMEM